MNPKPKRISISKQSQTQKDQKSRYRADGSDDVESTRNVEDRPLESSASKMRTIQYPAVDPIKQDKTFAKGFTLVQDDKATRRVIAPYLHVIRKNMLQKKTSDRLSKTFSAQLPARMPSFLIKDMSALLSDTVDLTSVLHDTTDVLRHITKSSGVVLYMVDEPAGEIFQSARYIINAVRHRVSWKIETGRTISAYVARTKEHIMVDDVLGDVRFPEGVGWKGPTIKGVLCVPVVTPNLECMAVVELYRDNAQPYKQSHLQTVVALTGWMGAAINQNKTRLALQKKIELNDFLLEITKCYFSEDVQIEKFVSEIVKFAKTIMYAERGAFYIMDKDCEEIVAEYFEECIEGAPDSLMQKKKVKLRFNSETDIVGIVARTGKAINIKDAYTDSRFNKDNDHKSGLITRSLLCAPILAGSDVLGVIQVVNKKTALFFDEADELLFETFSMYCSLALNYTRLFNKNKKSAKLNEIYKDMLQYHMRPSYLELSKFLNCPTLESLPENFNEFSWYITPEYTEFMPQLVHHMLRSVIGDNFVDMMRLGDFLITIRKSYRSNPYHNYDHGFNVLHSMYCILRRNLDIFTLTELIGLLVGAHCHDLNHKGFTNNFLQITSNALVDLYEESPLENHHIFVTMMILESSGAFDYLTKNEFHELKNQLHDIIIASDLAVYFRCRSRLVQVVTDGFDWQNPSHRTLLKSIMMTSTDLSGQSKPFKIAKRIIGGLYKEFYNQGDIEKSMGICPLSMMDRNKQHMIIEDQIQFINVVCMPCNEILASILPNTIDLLTLCTELRESWRELLGMKNKRVWRKEESFLQQHSNSKTSIVS